MSSKGLNKKEVSDRRRKYGVNEISEINKNTPTKILLRQIKKNALFYMLLIAATLSFVVGKNITGYTIILVITIVVGTAFFQEYRAEKAIDELKMMIVPISIVIREGKETELPSRELVPGDIVLLRSGERIPADCKIIESRELRTDESIITGESSEVEKNNDNKEKKQLFMGSYITNGRCTAEVTEIGMRTKFGKIANLITKAEKEMPLQKKINKITGYMVIVAIIVSLLTGMIMIINSETINKEVFIEVGLLVIALCVSAFPEGLPVVLTTTLSAGAYRMAKKNAIINRMSAVETLGETTVICTDKTGTITKGEMTVKEIFSDNKKFLVTGTGFSAEGEILIDKKGIIKEKEETLGSLIRAGVLCNDSIISREGNDSEYKIIGSPTEAALKILGAKIGIFIEDQKVIRTEEKPFSSVSKMMSVTYKEKGRSYEYIKGAPEIIIEQCNYIKRNNGIFKLTNKEKERIMMVNYEMNNRTLRTIIGAYIDDGKTIFLGIFGMEDPPREEVKEAIVTCYNAGINVKMITGDNKETAMTIAKEVGLTGRVITGKELDLMNDKKLIKIISGITVFARVSPEHKLRIVKILKELGEVVTMTGDGINDAPALKEAHIGVAMGKNGTDVSRSVADLTLKDDNFATIVTAIKEGRTIFNNIRKFVSYQLSCNHAELLILFLGVLLTPIFGWQIPVLLALQILFMNIVTDNLPAITLSMNSSSGDIMNDKPRRNAKIINKQALKLIIFTGIIMGLLSLGTFYITNNILKEEINTSRTVILVTLILLEIASAYNFRSFRKKVSNRSPMTNKYLFYASIISIIATLIIVYTPINKIFLTAPINWKLWVIAIIPAIIIIVLYDTLKELNNKKKYWDINED